MSDNRLKSKRDNNFMIKITTFIVDKRNLFFLIFAILIIFSLFSRTWVNVENSLSYYLPESTETKQALQIMEDEFTTYGTADLMVSNISERQAEEIQSKLESLDGVSMVTYENNESHFNNASALYNITFAYDESNEKCLDALNNLKEEMADYDCYISTELGDTLQETIASEMQVIIMIVAVIVVAVLMFTSSTWAEVPVLLITFLTSMILSMGINFVFGTISFVSNSVTTVLQLALSVDYAVIMCNRYKEERVKYEAREACIVALSKAIPEISSSSLTTIGGLVAMIFMQFKIGRDMGVVLIVAILCSLITVFTLMPGLLMLFSKAMDKTKHKNLVPKISFVGKFAYKTRRIVPPIFVAVIIVACIVSLKCPYVYGYTKLTTPIQNQSQIADEMIENNFGKTNMVAVCVPSGNFEKEKKFLNELDSRDEVDYTMGLPNIEAMDGYMLTDKLTPRQFSELLGLDYETAQLVYAAYAVNDEDYAKVVNGLSQYSVELVNMLEFVYKEVDEGYVTLDEDLKQTLTDAYSQIKIAQNQLEGENYSRALVYLNLDEEGEETFSFLDEIHDIAKKYYGEDAKVYVAGNSTSDYDLSKSFSRDNTVVSVLSILIVLVVLLFTFNSAGMPLLLILVIQGAIWLNFAVPGALNDNIFFMCYLIVSSIQMGANIDYAIVISNRYMELRETLDKEQAIIETMNQCFPTIITSGLMMSAAGVLIGKMTSEPCIAGIGQCIGRGTIISLFLVMLVLPQLLIVGEKIIRKTSFKMSSPVENINLSNTVRIDGPVYGTINGTVKGVMHAIVDGEINALVETNKIKEIEEEQQNENQEN